MYDPTENRLEYFLIARFVLGVFSIGDTFLILINLKVGAVRFSSEVF